MAFEFDLETLNDNLTLFNQSCPDQGNIVSKLEMLCKSYRKTTEDIADEIVSLLGCMEKKEVDMQALMRLEENLETQAKKIMNTPRSVKKPARVPFAERSGFILSGGPGDDDRNNHLNITASALSKLEGHYGEFSPFEGSPANEKFLKRANPSNVMKTIRGKKYQEKGLKSTSRADERVKVISKLPSNLYGGEKSSIVIEAKAKRMGELAERIQKTYEEIVDWGNPLMASVEAVYTYGQIVHDDSKEEKLGEHSVALMINDEDGTIVKLDFSKMLDDVTVFPGQIVAVRGVNETGEELQVDRIYTAPPLPVTKVESDTSKDIWFASGPYTAVDNCGYEHLCELLDKVVQEKPDILILAGPFVDRRNTFINKPAFTMKNSTLLESLLLNIKKKLIDTKTEVIIQPSSSRDLCIPQVFPSAPFTYDVKKFDSARTRMTFVPDPCVLRIGQKGIEIAVTSSEPVQGLSSTEFHRSANQENHDRMSRLNSHLLSQQSLHPLEPTEVPSAMGDVIEVCSLHSTPHVIFAPSKLAVSANAVGGCVFVNSSSLAKGSSGNYVKMSINMNAGELAAEKGESVADYSNIELVQI